jgi:hypothetical protein
MSDDSGTPPNTSLLSNLKNKVAFNLHQATYDPKANEFADQQAQKQKEIDDAKKQQQEQANTTDDNKDQGDPNVFSGKRLASKVWTQTINIFKLIFFPFLALMLAMIITNELIVYSAPIRIIFFIFTFLICYFFKYIAVLLSIYYLFRGGYSYYYNNMTDKPKRDIMPTIFGLMPITTYKPLSSLGTFFMYPFTYPKTEKGAIKLPEIMNNYLESLQESFPDLDKVRNLPFFVKGINQVKEDLKHLHDVKEPLVEANEEKPKNTNQSVPPKASAPENTNQSVPPKPSAPSNNSNNNPTSV